MKKKIKIRKTVNNYEEKYEENLVSKEAKNFDERPAKERKEKLWKI